MADHRPAWNILPVDRDIRLATATMRALDSQRPQHLRFFLPLLLLLLFFAFDGTRARSLRLEKRSAGRTDFGQARKLGVGENKGATEEIEHRSEEAGEQIGKDGAEATEGSRKAQENDGGEETDRASGKSGTLEGRVPINEEVGEKGGADKGADEAVPKEDREDVVLGAMEGGGIRRFDAGDETEPEIVEEVEDPRRMQRNEMYGTTGREVRSEEGPEEITARTKVYVSKVEKFGRDVRKDRAATEPIVSGEMPMKDPESGKMVETEKGDGTRSEDLGVGEKAEASTSRGQRYPVEDEDAVKDIERTGMNDGSSQRGHSVNDVNRPDDLELPKDNENAASSGNALVRRWKEEATLLQAQIRNSTFLQRLREQAAEVLPDIPEFTVPQLLEIMSKIPPTRSLSTQEVFHTSNMNASELTSDQLEIIKCAEQLVEERERRTFVTNVFDCIRGLDVLNCMRIFIWPVVADNLPPSVYQHLPALPIEMNVADWIQGNRDRSRSVRSGVRIEEGAQSPETILSNLLKDALRSNPSSGSYAKLPSFVDPTNQTLSGLLTPAQISVLQLAEKFLPESDRREYADNIFSCVRRFEYLGCLRYFAWPMVRRHFSRLPAFPDYQTWYPAVTMYPEYPIVPFPNFFEDAGKLPEAVDADATRSREPSPEALILHILQNTVAEFPTLSPPSPSFFVDASNASVLALIPPEQLTAMQMAERLLPLPVRPEFASRTLKCVQEFNYLSCVKYSVWPAVRQFSPSLPQLPDFLGWIPELPDFFGFLPQLPSLGDLFGTPSTEQPPTLPKNYDDPLKSSPSLESRVASILRTVQSATEKIYAISPVPMVGKDLLSTMTQEQMEIVRIASSMVPPLAKVDLVARFFGCLEEENDFVNCTRYVIWPCLALHSTRLPDFPEIGEEDPVVDQTESLDSNKPKLAVGGESKTITLNPAVPSDRLLVPNDSGNSDTDLSNSRIFLSPETAPQIITDQRTDPVITVTGTRFVPIFAELPESVILNILKSVRSSGLRPHPSGTLFVPTRKSDFSKLLNEQQENVVQAAEGLLPEASRPILVNRMLECVREKNFLACTRDIVWPSLMEYFPRLPSFPSFGSLQNFPDRVNSTHRSSESLSVTDVKTGQIGDAKVTITDTRFVPIFTEPPEAVILNILKTIRASVPDLPNSPLPPATIRTPEFFNFLTEQQGGIVQMAESLLPESIRPVLVNEMLSCIRENNFLDCTRDVAWPTIAQFFPRLPSFPNFVGSQSLPRLRLESTNVAGAASAPETSEKLDDAGAGAGVPSAEVKRLEATVEAILKEALSSGPMTLPRPSYLDTNNPSTIALVTRQEADIIRISESIVPETLRRAYVSRMLECVGRNNFLTCTRRVSWPTMKQFLPSLPEFPNFEGFPPQLPLLPQSPQLPGFPRLPSGEIPGFRTEPGEIGILADKVGSDLSTSKPLAGLAGPIEADEEKRTKTLSDVERTKRVSSEQPSEMGQEDVGSSSKRSRRKRRDVVDLFGSYSSSVGAHDNQNIKGDRSGLGGPFPNITESELLRLLVNVAKSKVRLTKGIPGRSKGYFVDALNATTRNSLNADQYEILKLAEDLNSETSRASLVSQVIRCVRSLSFIRCIGIFVWPMISSNLPSLPGPPSFGRIGPFGRAQETEIQQFFGMSPPEFETELLARKKSIESTLLSWYKSLLEEEFEVDLGLITVKGYGNGELGISFAGFRDGRAKWLKDNKNAPSILTIISDIMEEMLEQNEKWKNVKKGRGVNQAPSMDDELENEVLREFGATGGQRPIDDDDDRLTALFLERMKPEPSNLNGGDIGPLFSPENAYNNTFEGLFGTKLNADVGSGLRNLIGDRFKSFVNGDAEEPIGEVRMAAPEDKSKERSKVSPLIASWKYNLRSNAVTGPSKEEAEEERRESSNELNTEGRKEDQLDRDQASNTVEAFLDKYDTFEKGPKINYEITKKVREKEISSALSLHLPSLDDDILARKTTSSLIHLGRNLRAKVGQVMPGIGLVVSFLVQMALAHARAAASVASMLSNMALGSALFGMVRQALFGPSTRPKIKYVYDNDKVGAGVSWPGGYDGNYYGN